MRALSGGKQLPACVCLEVTPVAAVSSKTVVSFLGHKIKILQILKPSVEAEENCTVENKFSVQVYITYCVLLHLPLINNTHQSISTLLAAGVNCAWS